MIGGSDVIIRTYFPAEVAEQALKRMRSLWPNMIIENADTEETIDFSVPFYQQLPNEFFVYRDKAAKEMWDEEGACSENANTMIHVMSDHEQLTIVVDDLNDISSRQIIEATRAFANELALIRREFTA